MHASAQPTPGLLHTSPAPAAASTTAAAADSIARLVCACHMYVLDVQGRRQQGVKAVGSTTSTRQQQDHTTR